MSVVNHGAAATPRRGVLAFALCAVVLATLGAVASAPAARAADPATAAATTTTDLELRAGPGLRQRVVLIMPAGSRVTVHDVRRNGFSPVTYGLHAGWAAAAFLDKSANPDPAPPPGGSIIDLIYAAADRYGQPRADMLRVAGCESGLDPNAVNPAGSYGLFQFLPGTWATTPYASFDIFDPWASANAAGWMWANGRRGEWVCQ